MFIILINKYLSQFIIIWGLFTCIVKEINKNYLIMFNNK